MLSIKRNTLILLITCAQLALLVVGVGFFTQWLEGKLTRMAGAQIQADNAAVLQQTLAYLEVLEPADLTEGGPDWRRVQSQLEGVALPNEGAVFVVDPQSGRLVCHPALKAKRQLRRQDFGGIEFHHEDGAVPLSQAQGNGWYQSDHGLVFAVVGDMPNLPYKVVVQQDASISGMAISEILGYARMLLIVGPFLYALLAGCAAYELARRFEEGPDLNARVAEVEKTRNAFAFGLANLAELRDAESGHHLIRMRSYVRLLARQLQTDFAELQDDLYLHDLVQASALHDLGKIGVRESILLKPGRLSADERREMQKHTLVADCYLNAVGQLVEEDRFVQLARQISVGHHERWDGAGYPFGLKGDQIPLPARIVALADVYDALTSRRTYRARLSLDQARELIIKGAGVQFDPAVVQAFANCEGEFRRIAEMREPPSEDANGVVLLDGLRARSGKVAARKPAPETAPANRGDAERSTPAHRPTLAEQPKQTAAEQPVRAETADDPLDPNRVSDLNEKRDTDPITTEAEAARRKAHAELHRHEALTVTAEDIDDDDDGPALQLGEPDQPFARNDPSDDSIEAHLQQSVRSLKRAAQQVAVGAKRPQTPSPAPGSQEWLNMWQQIFTAQEPADDPTRNTMQFEPEE